MLQIIGDGAFAQEVACYEHVTHFINLLSSEKQMDESRPTLIAIGDPKTRKKIAETFKLNYTILNKGKGYGRVFYSFGDIICPGTILTTNIALGEHVIINLNCTIGHDTKIGAFTTLSPGVNVSGNVTIGELCYIGSNAVIREGITICDNVIIGAGGVVVKDITEPGTYVGNPVKKIK